MKTIHLKYLLSIFSLFLIFGCVAEKKISSKEMHSTTEARTVDNNTRTEICHNCQVKFKTTVTAQKMAMDSHTHGLCPKCTAKYQKSNL